MFAISLECIKKKIRGLGEVMDRYVIKKVQLSVHAGIEVLGRWVFTVEFLQLCYLSETFHDKMLGERALGADPVLGGPVLQA